MAGALEQLRQAEAHKEEGNKLFKDGHYRKALGQYHKVFCYVNGLQVPVTASSGEGKDDEASRSTPASSSQVPKERVDDLKKLKQSSRLNMAACYLKLEEFQKCVDACTQALQLGSSAKAYFRRGQAHLELRNLSGARNDLERARELTPNDPAIIVELRKLRSALSQADPKERASYAKMFEKASVQAEDQQTESKIEEITEPSPMEQDIPENPGNPEVKEESVEVKQEAVPPLPVDLNVRDEASRPDVVVRALKYSWQQNDDDIKVYIAFDQSEELQKGVNESDVTCEFGEWSFLLVVRSQVEGRAPLGLRLGDFHRRVIPDRCTCTVRSSRITVKLVKRVKENWWNFLQGAPIGGD
jgi:tetratricopeptide (TPR) repeat protein